MSPRPMTIRVYTVHPDGTTTEVVARHVAATSELRDLHHQLRLAQARPPMTIRHRPGGPPTDRA